MPSAGGNHAGCVNGFDPCIASVMNRLPVSATAIAAYLMQAIVVSIR